MSKKQKNPKKEDDDLDDLVNHILSSEPAKPDNECAEKTCRQKTSLMGFLCGYCRRKFCMKHRLPEKHSSACEEKAKIASRATYKQDSMRIITEEKKKPGSTYAPNGSSESKSRKNLEQRLKNKLKEHQKQRTSPNK
ncbi:hypothetical protein K493DRAFT_315955 [Basidiobolus meristosporus CBS 931.73]|uniref:AN1-type domain-containing protein n=1 Tax=Basidiobolus meristosporus CBS 931.73 TaxID=1314790 RepID=A0A1Y1Y7H6_9FUNG|nr:hypothetical protein K493DRAFT_315955 [Basidiobolus meristosporus CBS 931.73]|eukprot:ORX93534.1 hypothetical protein K493DRAFT_315955 [Basidiobolus meristosporus CBS 931.73]